MKQLENINTSIISVVQWGYLSLINQNLSKLDSVEFGSLNLTNDLTVDANLIELASNNISQSYDLGMYWKYQINSILYAGLYRDMSQNSWVLFDHLTTKPSSFTVDYNNLSLSNLKCGMINNVNINTLDNSVSSNSINISNNTTNISNLPTFPTS